MGVALLAALLFIVARPMLLGGADETTTTTPPPAVPTPQPTPRPAKPEPRVVLLPGLPAQIANKLRYSKVVVVSLYQGNAGSDRAAVTAASAGAKAVGAGFLAVNVLDEKSARSVQSFVGLKSTPAVVVVRRPGRTVATLEGAASADQQLVSQAAHNAGANRR
jgi:hypothetical protein